MKPLAANVFAALYRRQFDKYHTTSTIQRHIHIQCTSLYCGLLWLLQRSTGCAAKVGVVVLALGNSCAMCHVCVHENNITLIAESNVHAHLKQRVQLLVGPKAMFDTTRPIARCVHSEQA